MGITKAEFDALIQRDSGPDGHILSVYLDSDQSRAANLNRGFIVALTQRLRTMEQQIADERLRSDFHADAERVLSTAEKYVPRGRTLIFFCDASSNYLFECELRVPIDRTEVRWERKPYVRPLVEMFDEYERYAVVLLGKREARLFTVWLGEVEENREVFSPERRKRPNQVGHDYALSQSNLQQRDDEITAQHLKEVASVLEELWSGKRFDRLFLGGQHQIVKAFEEHVSKKVRERVVGEISLAPDASPRDVLDAAMKIHEESERKAETAAVEHLITAAAKERQAAMGLQPTLDAMRLGSIMRLVYVQDYVQPGKQCANCESLFLDGIDSCAFCGNSVRPVDDVVSRLVERVVDSGGEAEMVRGNAAERLRKTGNIGAFLRF